VSKIISQALTSPGYQFPGIFKHFLVPSFLTSFLPPPNSPPPDPLKKINKCKNAKHWTTKENRPFLPTQITDKHVILSSRSLCDQMEYAPCLFGFQNPHTEIISELEKTSSLSEMLGTGSNKLVVSW